MFGQFGYVALGISVDTILDQTGTFDAVIVGAGLAGSSAAIQLAGRGYRVALLEQKRYPTHKLCGEFMSTEVQGMLRRLGVLDTVRQADARPIRRVVLSSSLGGTFSTDLPGEGLGLSRYCLDFLLFLRARELGAVCEDGATVYRVTGSLEEGFELSTRAKTFRARVVLGAFGKWSRMDGTLDRKFIDKNEPYVAFKAHYEGASMPPQVEVYGFPRGYCGLAPVENGRINVCWMAHEDLLASSGGIDAMIATHLSKNPHLRRRLDELERVSERFEAVSQISLRQKSLFDRDVCMVGDAAQMIAPLCGDGMGMALKSAELAVPPAAAFLDGDLTAHQFKRSYTRIWKRRFSGRLRLGRQIQRVSLRPFAASAAVYTCRLLPSLGRWAVRHTRGTP